MILSDFQPLNLCIKVVQNIRVKKKYDIIEHLLRMIMSYIALLLGILQLLMVLMKKNLMNLLIRNLLLTPQTYDKSISSFEIYLALIKKKLDLMEFEKKKDNTLEESNIDGFEDSLRNNRTCIINNYENSNNHMRSENKFSKRSHGSVSPLKN